ncbi:MAG TPA: CDP-alcohol phosphatidyltransferase family protein [Candidatus Aminicenantes bacterium]|nr:CDP-alcohol phosphatidyltransferase family protein [Candidatus Aminicenantes bacterium]
MLGSSLRKKCTKSLDKVGRLFAWTRIPPNVFSSLALVLAAGGALLFHLGHRFPAFVLIGLACLWDTIDGGVARAENRVTKFGYYIEGIIDKWVEVIIYLGLATSGFALEAFLVISASLLLSFAKPRAAMVVPLGEHDWPAIGERLERLLLLNIGLLVSLFCPVVRLGRHAMPTLAVFLRALFVIVLVGGVQRILYAKKIIERGGLDKMNVLTRNVFNHEGQ